MATTEKELQHMIAEDLWNRDDAVEHLLKHCIAGHKAPYREAIGMLRHTTIEMVDGKAVYGTAN